MEVHASFEKRVSDNNYGGECSHVELIAQIADGDDPMECAAALQAWARTRVHMDLNASLNRQVRQQVQLPARTAATVPTDYPDEDPF